MAGDGGAGGRCWGHIIGAVAVLHRATMGISGLARCCWPCCCMHHADHNGGTGAAVFSFALEAGSSGIVSCGGHAPLWFQHYMPMGDAGALAVLVCCCGWPIVRGSWLDTMVAQHGDLGTVVVHLCPFGSRTSVQCGAFSGRESGCVWGAAHAPGSSRSARGIVAAIVLAARPLPCWCKEQ